jgi:hypothetical protein
MKRAACRILSIVGLLIQGLSCGGGRGASVTSAPSRAAPIVTGIHDPVAFINRCPTSDPAINTIKHDFEFLSDGVRSAAQPTCTEPYGAMPVTQLSDELIALQSLRAVYYMSQGTAGKLPWTRLALYEWMKSEVAGIDFKTQQGLSQCCEVIKGKRYIMTSKQDTANRKYYRDWVGISGWVALLAHEARHADGPNHVTGCPGFPTAIGPAGCDRSYDPAHISSYGIQYWLFSGWATGSLNVGIACAPPATAQRFAVLAASAANGYLVRFITSPPPSITATIPYGGACLSP